jgi:dTDP-4-amino-4,6-dideoxygalactose transaminase
LDDRNRLQSYLKEHGIDSKVHYEYVLGDLPIGKNLTKPDLLSTSVMLSRGVLSLPMYPELTDIEIEYIANRIIDFYK